MGRQFDKTDVKDCMPILGNFFSFFAGFCSPSSKVLANLVGKAKIVCLLIVITFLGTGVIPSLKYVEVKPKKQLLERKD